MSNSPTATPGLWKASETARALGVSPETIYLWSKKGLIPTVKFGATYRYRPESIRQFIQERESPAKMI